MRRHILMVLALAHVVFGQELVQRSVNQFQELPLVNKFPNSLQFPLIGPVFSTELDRDVLVVAGGYSPRYTFANITETLIDNSLWLFNGIAWRSTTPGLTVIGAGLISFQADQFFFFGGSFGLPGDAEGFYTYTPSNDLSIAYINGSQPLTIPSPENVTPSAYYGSGKLSQNIGVVFGGLGPNSTVLAGTVAVNFERRSAYKVSISGASPPPVWQPATQPFGEELYVTGGCLSLACDLSDVAAIWRFKCDNTFTCEVGTWQEIKLRLPRQQFLFSSIVLSHSWLLFDGIGDVYHVKLPIQTQNTTLTLIAKVDASEARIWSTGAGSNSTKAFGLFGKSGFQVLDLHYGVVILSLPAVVARLSLTSHGFQLFTGLSYTTISFDPPPFVTDPTELGKHLSFIRRTVDTHPPRTGFGGLATSFRDTVVYWGGVRVNGFIDLSAPTLMPYESDSWNPLLFAPDVAQPIGTFMFVWVAMPALGSVYMFGGLTEQGLSNELWVFSENTHWEKPRTVGPTPAARAGAAGVGTNVSTLIIFGGFSTTGSDGVHELALGKTLDDLWVQSGIIGNYTWKSIDTGFPKPSGRGGAQMTSHEGHAIMFGGTTSETTSNECWLLDLKSFKWKLLEQTAQPGSPVPTARSLGNLLSIGKQVVLYGGSSSAELSRDALISQTHSDIWAGELVSGVKGQQLMRWLRLAENAGPNVTGASMVQLPHQPLPGYPVGPQLLLQGGFALHTLSQTFSSLQTTHLGAVSTQATTLQCPQGYEGRIGETSCTLCRKGYFSDSPGLSCQKCPAQLTTSSIGAVALAACNICLPGVCHHGTCHVANAHVSCTCATGFRGQRCDENIVLLVVFASVGGLLVLGLVLLFFNLRRRMSSVRMESTLKDLLLEEQQYELDELVQAWNISMTDVQLHTSIAQGAFAEVYRGEYHGHAVAVKFLKESLAVLDPEVAKDFEAEITLLRTLRHRNVVFFYGAGTTENNLPYLVTEFVSRGSLRMILVDHYDALSTTKKHSFLVDILTGMSFLHSHTPPLVHRDLKSANLLVTDSWVVKVADFGTARVNKALKSGPVQSFDSREMTAGVGTLLWCSPEVSQGAAYGQEADVYSFGIVLWEVFTGKLPYEHLETAFEIRAFVADGGRPKVPSSVPALYQNMMTSCWSADPTQRPTMNQCLVDLEAHDENTS